jgi:tetratricopeptide (TPR) repeat protein
VAQFRRAAGLKSDMAEARYCLGVSLIQAEETDAGVSELEKATGMKGREVDSWIHIARARAGRGDLTGAHAAIEAALKLAPENAEALVERGETWRREKKLDLALEDFERAIALDPRNAEAHLARGQALLEPQATRGEAAADPAVARREMERSRAALAAFTGALEIKADLAEAYEGAGRACMQAWDHARGSTEKAARVQAAVQHFEHAVRYFPERKSGHVSLIRALHEAGKVEESVAAMHRARKRWPGDPRFQKRLPPAEDGDE